MFGFAEGKRKERKGRYFYCLVSRVGRKCERNEEKVSLGPIKPCHPKLGGRARKTEQGKLLADQFQNDLGKIYKYTLKWLQTKKLKHVIYI